MPTGMCLLGNASGWSASCCENYSDCYSCSRQSHCGWCASSGMCISGNSGGPSSSSCAYGWADYVDDCCSAVGGGANASSCAAATTHVPQWEDQACRWWVHTVQILLFELLIGNLFLVALMPLASRTLPVSGASSWLVLSQVWILVHFRIM